MRTGEKRNRETERAVMAALVDRGEEGMTVLELRGRVDSDIDDIEAALETLKAQNRIAASQSDGRTIIRATDDPDPELSPGEQVAAALRRFRRVLRRFLFP